MNMIIFFHKPTLSVRAPFPRPGVVDPVKAFVCRGLICGYRTILVYIGFIRRISQFGVFFEQIKSVPVGRVSVKVKIQFVQIKIIHLNCAHEVISVHRRIPPFRRRAGQDSETSFRVQEQYFRHMESPTAGTAHSTFLSAFRREKRTFHCFPMISY